MTPTSTATATNTPGGESFLFLPMVQRQNRYNIDADLDSDGDGVSDKIENGAPNNGDGNGDGIADWRQPNVASLPSATGSGYLTLAGTAGVQLRNTRAITPTVAPPAGVNLPHGLLDFESPNLPVDGRLVLMLIDRSKLMSTSYWKYGPTADDASDHWYNFAWDGTTGAQFSGHVIVLTFVDGLRGDADLSANGVIVAPGGPGVQSQWNLFLPFVNRTTTFVYREEVEQNVGDE
jgi:hypothetical protein